MSHNQWSTDIKLYDLLIMISANCESLKQLIVIFFYNSLFFLICEPKYDKKMNFGPRSVKD